MLLRRKQSPNIILLATAKGEANAFCTLAGISVEQHRVRFGFGLLKAHPTCAMWIKLMLIRIYRTVL